MAVKTDFASGFESVDIALMMAAVALILVGIGFRISMIPFYFWTPDVYHTAERAGLTDGGSSTTDDIFSEFHPYSA